MAFGDSPDGVPLHQRPIISIAMAISIGGAVALGGWRASEMNSAIAANEAAIAKAEERDAADYARLRAEIATMDGRLDTQAIQNSRIDTRIEGLHSDVQRILRILEGPTRGIEP